MKKILIFIFLILISLIGFYFLQKDKSKEVKSESKNVVDVVKSNNSTKEIPETIQMNHQEPSREEMNTGRVEKTKKIEASDEKFKEYEKMESEWLYNAKEIVGEKNYNKYLDLRTRCEKEKLEAYKDFHNYLRQKYGDNYAYNLSEDQSVREKKINQDYLNQLLKLIGEAKFKNYLKARDDYNEELKKTNRQYIQIEF